MFERFKKKDRIKGIIKNWEELYKRPLWGWANSTEIIETIRPYVRGRVLDLGCGEGRYLIQLNNIVGLDISRNAITRARARARIYGINAEFVLGDGMNIPFKDETFECVLCMGVLQHFLENERKMVVDEVYRILKPYGIFVVSVSRVGDSRFGKGTCIEKNTFVRGGIPHHYFTHDELNELLRDFDILISNDKIMIVCAKCP
jgi:SAM-dependent methyltransferase